MTHRRAFLIVNPISGTTNKRGRAKVVDARLAPLGIGVTHAWTTCRGDATRLAKNAVAKGYDMVIAAGGDGTINETAIAMCGTGVPMGIIPCGSGNGLARHLNIPIDIKASLDIIAQGHTEICDSGSANGIPFFCTFGTGFDAAVSEKFAKSKRRGKLTYIRNTFKEFMSYEPEEYVIKANGEVLTERAFVVAVCNASQYGNNAYIAPHASITDGLLDVTIIHYGNLLTTALVGVDLLTGFIDKNFLIHSFRAKNISISRKTSGAVHVDGEPMVMDPDIDIRCHERQLCVYTPPTDKPFRPLLTPMMSMLNEFGYKVRQVFER